MSRFSIRIFGYGINPHVRCFEDFSSAVGSALKTLGHEVVPHTDAKPGRLILFGANNVIDPGFKLDSEAIIYNAEQVSAKQQWNLMQNLQKFRQNVIWDYSDKNVRWLSVSGIERPVMCPVGHISTMEQIASVNEDIDVLFYGSVNPRRREVLESLDKAGLRVVRLFGVYGLERDEMIARSKVVLNLHFYENPVFEIFRCSHLLANRKAVVTEDGGTDEVLEDFARASCTYVSKAWIVDACKMLCSNEGMRRKAEERGYEAFKKLDLVSYVREAVERS